MDTAPQSTPNPNSAPAAHAEPAAAPSASHPSAAPLSNAAPLSAAIDLLWARFLPEIRHRAEIVSAAAAACATAPLPATQCHAALEAAHKLAGTLGTFSLQRGTDLARELELAFAAQTRPSPEQAAHLASVAAELRSLIDSRK